MPRMQVRHPKAWNPKHVRSKLEKSRITRIPYQSYGYVSTNRLLY